MVVDNLTINFRSIIRLSKALNCQPKLCMNYTLVQMRVGHLFTTINFRRKKYWHRNTVGTEKKRVIKNSRIQLLLFLPTLRQMIYYFTPVTCFRKDIRTALSSFFTGNLLN